MLCMAILLALSWPTTKASAFFANPSFISASTNCRSLFAADGSLPDDAMPILPEDVIKYSQVPKDGKVFTATTIPKGLLNKHSTKAGTWGVIKVSKGSLEYNLSPRSSTDDHDPPPPTRFVLNSEYDGIIEPERLHDVAPVGDEEVEFVVEFHRLPGTGPVDEKRE